MAEQRKMSTLEAAEDGLYAVLETSNNPDEVRTALAHLGMTHLWMEPAKLGQGLREIWASMHGRPGLENLGTAAQTLLLLTNYGINPLSQEHAAVLQERAEAAAK